VLLVGQYCFLRQPNQAATDPCKAFGNVIAIETTSNRVGAGCFIGRLSTMAWARERMVGKVLRLASSEGMRHQAGWCLQAFSTAHFGFDGHFAESSRCIAG